MNFLRKSRLIVLALVCLSVIMLACQPLAPKQVDGNAQPEIVNLASGSYRNISAATLRSMLASKDFQLVDVHVPHEGRLPQTDARIAYDQIEQHLDQLPADKTARIVLYCRSGRMSQIAAEKLVPLGYTNLWNLKEGMVGWQEAGYSLEPN